MSFSEPRKSLQAIWTSSGEILRSPSAILTSRRSLSTHHNDVRSHSTEDIDKVQDKHVEKGCIFIRYCYLPARISDFHVLTILVMFNLKLLSFGRISLFFIGSYNDESHSGFSRTENRYYCRDACLEQAHFASSFPNLNYCVYSLRTTSGSITAYSFSIKRFER